MNPFGEKDAVLEYWTWKLDNPYRMALGLVFACDSDLGEPFLVSQTPGYIWKGYTGWLVPVFDPDQYAADNSFTQETREPKRSVRPEPMNAERLPHTFRRDAESSRVGTTARRSIAGRCLFLCSVSDNDRRHSPIERNR